MTTAKTTSNSLPIGRILLLGGGLVAAAVIALLFAASQGGESSNDNSDAVISGAPTTAESSETSTQGQSDAFAQGAVNPGDIIQSFLPAGGTAAACSEDIGVILAQGYGADLTINGTALSPEQLNVNLNPDGTISNEVTATRSKGQYSFEAEANCPDGPLIRATDNRLDVCIFRLGDATRRCLARDSFVFDAA